MFYKNLKSCQLHSGEYNICLRLGSETVLGFEFWWRFDGKMIVFSLSTVYPSFSDISHQSWTSTQNVWTMKKMQNIQKKLFHPLHTPRNWRGSRPDQVLRGNSTDTPKYEIYHDTQKTNICCKASDVSACYFGKYFCCICRKEKTCVSSCDCWAASLTLGMLHNLCR